MGLGFEDISQYHFETKISYLIICNIVEGVLQIEICKFFSLLLLA